jgi:nucleoside-diphosphate-sugar epimerase
VSATVTRALITGGNGFLGSHLARALLSAGYRVRVMIQPGTDTERLAGLELEVCQADLREPAQLAVACAGQELAFHLAGVVQDWGPRRLFQAVNVGGTRNLIEAAQGCGVRRIVFVSSLAVHRYVGIPDGDERWPRDNTRHPYGASKIACEDLLLEAQRAGQIEAVIVRPGVFPFGPGDRLALPELLRNHRRYRHVAGGEARLCTAYAPNLADGLLRCAEVASAAGEVYVIADDETPTWHDLMTQIFEGVGLPSPRRSVPLWAALAGAVAAEAISGLSRRPPLINRYRVCLAGRDCVFSSRKAQEQLGWRPRVPLERALEQTVAWLNEERVGGARAAP